MTRANIARLEAAVVRAVRVDYQPTCACGACRAMKRLIAALAKAKKGKQK